jgi:rhodanese-related sulfurtransferase
VISAGTLTPEELRAWREEGRAYALLDVRSPQECEIAALLPAIRIPMNEIPARLAEIPAGTPIVVICHLGERSGHVAAFLAVSGFSHVYNLEGGIDAYASRVDPAIPRY